MKPLHTSIAILAIYVSTMACLASAGSSIGGPARVTKGTAAKYAKFVRVQQVLRYHERSAHIIIFVPKQDGEHLAAVRLHVTDDDVSLVRGGLAPSKNPDGSGYVRFTIDPTLGKKAVLTVHLGDNEFTAERVFELDLKSFMKDVPVKERTNKSTPTFKWRW